MIPCGLRKVADNQPPVCTVAGTQMGSSRGMGVVCSFGLDPPCVQEKRLQRSVEGSGLSPSEGHVLRERVGADGIGHGEEAEGRVADEDPVQNEEWVTSLGIPPGLQDSDHCDGGLTSGNGPFSPPHLSGQWWSPARGLQPRLQGLSPRRQLFTAEVSHSDGLSHTAPQVTSLSFLSY